MYVKIAGRARRRREPVHLEVNRRDPVGDTDKSHLRAGSGFRVQSSGFRVQG